MTDESKETTSSESADDNHLPEKENELEKPFIKVDTMPRSEHLAAQKSPEVKRNFIISEKFTGLNKMFADQQSSFALVRSKSVIDTVTGVIPPTELDIIKKYPTSKILASNIPPHIFVSVPDALKMQQNSLIYSDKNASLIAADHRAVNLQLTENISNKIFSPSTDALDVEKFKLPPHPAHETNERLAKIEKQFEQIAGIATRSAEISMELQKLSELSLAKFDGVTDELKVSAGNFLDKFDAASTKNDQSAKHAIWTAWLGICIAVIALLITAYTSFFKPDDALEMRETVSGLKIEISKLTSAQIEASRHLAEVLGASNQELAAALRELRASPIKTDGITPIIAPNHP